MTKLWIAEPAVLASGWTLTVTVVLGSAWVTFMVTPSSTSETVLVLRVMFCTPSTVRLSDCAWRTWFDATELRPRPDMAVPWESEKDSNAPLALSVICSAPLLTVAEIVVLLLMALAEAVMAAAISDTLSLAVTVTGMAVLPE